MKTLISIFTLFFLMTIAIANASGGGGDSYEGDSGSSDLAEELAEEEIEEAKNEAQEEAIEEAKKQALEEESIASEDEAE